MIPRLKSLELHGYKTFASRMVFEFPAEITAIVGPNGAGKSNVADALRWVLGEQSYSLLRGRRTEDMIFSGSEQRSRASMATASITFDNADGWLPTDFSEVTIARRAYRDGQNEYLMNGQRVRLKEISELLSKSGLAERTYTIIGQGLVDAALSLKPDERRRFFEEAAGIGLCRIRREEALNRLDNTRRNLERVQDILSELEPRLKSLERQARRAQEYEQLRADLQVLLREWHGHQWLTTQEKLHHAQGVFDTQDQRRRDARLQLDRIEGQVEACRQQLQDLRQQMGEWHTQSADLHRLREKISRDLAVMDERRRSLHEQQQSLQGDQVHQEEDFQARLERSTALEQEHSRLQAELAEAGERLQNAQQTLAQRQQERNRAEDLLRQARQALVETETRQVQLKARHGELSSRVETLQATHQSLAAEITGAEESIQTARRAREQAGQQRAQAEVQLKQAEESLQHLRQQQEQLDDHRRQLVEEKNRLEVEKTRLQAQFEVLEQAERSFSGLNQGARLVLEAARQKSLPGDYRALSSMLEVPAEYEVAIAAVLGESLDGVLLHPKSDLDAVLKLLEEGNRGRAVLYPLDWIKASERLGLPSDPGVIGLAVNLVKADSIHLPLVDLLLGRSIVVRDRSTAHRLMKSLPDAARLVTLQGEVFWANGMVTAGRDGRAGVIARPRQKRELQEAAQKVLEHLKILDDKLAALDKEQKTLQAHTTEHQNRLAASRRRLEQDLQACQHAELELEQAQQRCSWQKEQQTIIKTQLQQAGEESAMVAANLETSEVGVASLNDQVQQRSRELAGVAVDEFQAQVTHWTTRMAVTERALHDAASRRQEILNMLEESRRQQAALAERLQLVINSFRQLEKDRSAQLEQESSLSCEIEALRLKIEPAEQELASVEHHYASLQTEQSTAQQAVSMAERSASQSQVELIRQREALGALQRHIEDDLGLVALEYNPHVTGPTPLPLGELVKTLPRVETISPDLEENISRQKTLIRRIGAVNPEAQSEFRTVKERFEFMSSQVEDIKKADADLRKVIDELDELMKLEFRKTFDAVAEEFRHMFARLFGGGSARLVLLDEENPIETGVDIEARLPGRREQGLALLSGGERSLTAVALIFSLLKVSPTPFCVLDEVDAMLDEANVGRFCELLAELSLQTQFIVITHNRNTVQIADVIYGVTMGRDSVSQVISLKMDELSEDMVH